MAGLDISSTFQAKFLINISCLAHVPGILHCIPAKAQSRVSKAEPAAFDATAEQAISLYRKPRICPRLLGHYLKGGTSWDATTSEYVQSYESLLQP